MTVAVQEFAARQQTRAFEEAIARMATDPIVAANSASSPRISGAPAPESTPRSRTRAIAARSSAVRIGQRWGFTALVGASSCSSRARGVVGEQAELIGSPGLPLR